MNNLVCYQSLDERIRCFLLLWGLPVLNGQIKLWSTRTPSVSLREKSSQYMPAFQVSKAWVSPIETSSLNKSILPKVLTKGSFRIQVVLFYLSRELDKSNIRFAGPCNPHCCMRWPEWRSTSQHTRGTGPAARHCWWRWCRCCPCTHRSHSYLPDALRSRTPRRRWNPFLASPEGKARIYCIYYHSLGSLSQPNKIPNKNMREFLRDSYL